MNKKPAAENRPRKRSRRRSTSDNTRDKILDAAEMLFGERTFDTVSLRDITQKARVTLALASYHFGTKEKLFAEVVKRRANILNEMRQRRLAALQATNAPSTAHIIDAFMHPLFAQMASGQKGWKSYLFILAQLGQSNRWLHLIRENFDETAEQFLTGLRRVLPHVPVPLLMRGFAMVLVSMLQTLAQNRRIDALSHGAVLADELDDAYAALLTFCSCGLEGLANQS